MNTIKAAVLSKLTQLDNNQRETMSQDFRCRKFLRALFHAFVKISDVKVINFNIDGFLSSREAFMWVYTG